jgi:uncharacterized protein YeaO (DUF488 family)
MLFTVQMAYIHRLPPYVEIIDITTKSAKAPWDIFAPTWDMVNGLKEGKITEDLFVKQYISLMRCRYKQNQKTFKEIINKSLKANIALACYCPADAFCHRKILASILAKIEPQIVFMGEFFNNNGTSNSEQLSLFDDL